MIPTVITLVKTMVRQEQLFRYFLTYHGETIGKVSKMEIAKADADGKDEEHQGPEITLLFQFVALVLEHLDQLGENPTLQGECGCFGRPRQLRFTRLLD